MNDSCYSTQKFVLGFTHLVGHWDIAVKDPDGTEITQNTFAEQQKEDPAYEDKLPWENYYDLKNIEIYELPSSSDIGTYIFTIAGVAILAVVVFMLFSRKKDD